MIGKHKFKVGMRVRPSQEGIRALIFPKTRHSQRGTVQRVDQFNSPTVLWDGRKTISSYHPDYITPVESPSKQEGK